MYKDYKYIRHQREIAKLTRRMDTALSTWSSDPVVQRTASPFGIEAPSLHL